MLSLLSLGFLLGIRHALEADHIATVASLASSHPSRSQMIRQGLAWGMGHSLTLLFFGAIVLWMDRLISEQLATGLEMAVGALMIFLGADVVRRVFKTGFHFHAHRHNDGQIHFHAHCHAENKSVKDHQGLVHHHIHKNQFPLRALLIGLVHGMAGSAALVLLVVDQIGSLWSGLLYVSVFGVGSIAGMLIFSIVISIPLAFSAKKSQIFHNGLQLSIGLLTSGLGLILLSEGL